MALQFFFLLIFMKATNSLVVTERACRITSLDSGSNFDTNHFLGYNEDHCYVLISTGTSQNRDFFKHQCENEWTSGIFYGNQSHLLSFTSLEEEEEILNYIFYNQSVQTEGVWFGIVGESNIPQYWDDPWKTPFDQTELNYTIKSGGSPFEDYWYIDYTNVLDFPYGDSVLKNTLVMNGMCKYKVPRCNSISAYYRNVCGGNGYCISDDECQCFPGYEYDVDGGTCVELVKCYDISADNTSVCGNGNGLCVAENQCNCSRGWYGHNCDDEYIDEFAYYGYNKSAFGHVLKFNHYFRTESILATNNIQIGEWMDCSNALCGDGSIFGGFECMWGMSDDSFYVKMENEVEKRSVEGYVNSVLTPVICFNLITIDLSVNIKIIMNTTFNNPDVPTLAIVLSTVLPFLLISCVLVLIVVILIGILVYFRYGNKRGGAKDGKDIKMDEKEVTIIEKEESEFAKLKVNELLYTIKWEDIKIKKKIGKGAYSTVFSGTWMKENIAFKSFDTKMLGDSKDDFEMFEKELLLISSLRHNSIVLFLGASIKPPRCGIVLELCEDGDLSTFLTKNKDSIDVKGKIVVLNDVCKAMLYLHSKNVIHRDLKPENILIKNGKAKITDFGISKLLADQKENSNQTQSVGTSLYMAPEVSLTSDYGTKCDVFSFGIITYCVLTLNFDNPYNKKSKSNFNVQVKVASDPSYRPDVKEIDENVRNEYDWLIKMMINNWDHSPEVRNSFETNIKIIEENKK